MYSALAQYQDTQISTANPEKILVMLYDGAIKFTRIAIDRLTKGDIPGKGLYISKAQAIIGELMSTLDHEVGGDVAGKLEQLYIYLIDEYVAANVNGSEQPLQNALGILTTLRDTWEEAVRVANKEPETCGIGQLERV